MSTKNYGYEQEFSQVDKDIPRTADTVGEVLRLRAASTPDAPALMTFGLAEPERWTFAQLFQDASSAARSLLRDYQPGAVVATCSVNRPELVVLQFAAALAGMSLVTMNPSYSADELGYVVRHSRAVVLFASTDVHERLKNQTVPSLQRVNDLTTDWRRLLVEGEGLSGELPTLTADDTAQVQYTSGTTARPKAAVIRHRAMTWTASGFVDRLELQTRGPWVNPMPLFHTAGNVLGVLGAVSAGVEQVLVPFRPDTVRAAAAETDAEVLGAAPTMLHAIVRDTAQEPAALSSLRVIYTGGATLEPTFIRQVENTLGARVSVGFGMTETCGCISMTRPSDDDHVRFETSGRLIPATEISVVDSITGTRLPAGQEGEICVRGDRVTPGYLDAEGKLTAATDGQGWLHTGDVGTIESGGSLIVTGRIKDMIKSGGENVSPAEVEACLAGHPTVSQVAVIGVPSEQWGELVTAFVQLRPGATTTVAELDDYCRKLLAPHKRPRRWNIADVLPVTASGKLRKQSLRDMVRSGQAELLAVNRVVPR